MTEILSQILGIMALIVTVICYQFNDRKKILLLQIVASILFMSNLALRNAMTGALLNIHGICRALIFYQRGRHKWADSPFWAVFFAIMATVCVAITWQSPLDIFPLIGTISTTFAYYVSSPKLLRFLTLPSPPMWFVYNVAIGSIGGICNEIFVLCSLLTAIIRYDICGKKSSGIGAQDGAQKNG